MPNNGLRPRPGPRPKLIQGPATGQRSLYEQNVLDEDTYTEALSHIVGRDFFPNLPHIHATNDYLSALADNDPERLSASIRRLSRIAQEKEEARGGGSARRKDEEEMEAEHARRREREMAGTPYISTTGRRMPHRTPVGARGWETPRDDESVLQANVSDEEDDAPGPLTRPVKRRRQAPIVRDDLTLDAFQRNYTSEDNASFAHIVEEENKLRRAEKAWAWEAERVAADRRIAGEERRKLILDAATSGNWRVDANGRRLIGGLAEGGAERAEGEVWKERKLIAAVRARHDNEADASTMAEPHSALVKRSDSGALIKATDPSTASALPPPAFKEEPLPDQHPLSQALVKAGLPPTALVSTEDGVIVPHREASSGSKDGRGRGADERARRDAVEAEVMGDEKVEHRAYGGSGVEQWSYQAMNPLMFPPDANTKPYPTRVKPNTAVTTRGEAPKIAHANTRLNDEEDEPNRTRRGSPTPSSASSWVDAVVKGVEYRPGGGKEYDLVHEPDPEDEIDPETMPPLMTIGTLLATPRAIVSSSDPLDLDGPSYKLPESKKRDDLGRKLGVKASRSISERARAHAPRPAPSTPRLSDALRAAANRTQRPDRSVRGTDMRAPGTPRREDSLTPAAKSLLDRSLGRTPQRTGGLGLGGLGMGGGRGKGRRDVGSMAWSTPR